MSAPPVPKMTVEEYLAADQVSERPLEYHDGEIFPMVDATLSHGMIATKLARCVDQRLDGSPCRSSGPVRVRISATKYVYPDLLVFCGKPAVTSDPDPSITNPKVIFEILSPSTEGYDYGPKFQLYRQLPSFEEYVLVAQDQPRVEVLRRMEDGRWILSTYEGEDATVAIESLNLQIPLREIYAQLP